MHARTSHRAQVPTLGLWVGPRGLAVATNERGFTERDVRALCDVGASSKEEGASEQTGEKGIGWV